MCGLGVIELQRRPPLNDKLDLPGGINLDDREEVLCKIHVVMGHPVHRIPRPLESAAFNRLATV